MIKIGDKKKPQKRTYHSIESKNTGKTYYATKGEMKKIKNRSDKINKKNWHKAYAKSHVE